MLSQSTILWNIKHITVYIMIYFRRRKTAYIYVFRFRSVLQKRKGLKARPSSSQNKTNIRGFSVELLKLSVSKKRLKWSWEWLQNFCWKMACENKLKIGHSERFTCWTWIYTRWPKNAQQRRKKHNTNDYADNQWNDISERFYVQDVNLHYSA